MSLLRRVLGRLGHPVALRVVNDVVVVPIQITSLAEVDQFGTVSEIALGRGRKLRSMMLV